MCNLLDTGIYVECTVQSQSDITWWQPHKEALACTIPHNVLENQQPVHENHHLTIWGLCDAVGIGLGACRKILIKELVMCIAVKFVPSMQLQQFTSTDETLSRAITDESWVCGYALETKKQSFFKTQKAKLSKSNIKSIVIVYCDIRGICSCWPSCEFQLLLWCFVAIAWKCEEMSQPVAREKMFHRDSIPTATVSAQQFLAQNSLTVVSHPPLISWILPSAASVCSRTWKWSWKNVIFDNVENIQMKSWVVLDNHVKMDF